VRRVRHETGSAAVELALVLPLVLMMVLALLQVGLLAKDSLVVVQAAREGAREAHASVRRRFAEAVGWQGSALRSM
jgi:Flp pilus assembly protein TadG